MAHVGEERSSKWESGKGCVGVRRENERERASVGRRERGKREKFGSRVGV